MIWWNMYIAVGCVGVCGLGCHLWAWFRVRELQRTFVWELWTYETPGAFTRAVTR